jgi:hypothetical protein
MDVSARITRDLTSPSRGLWQFVIARAACSASGLSPDDWYTVSAPAAAARREAAAAITICSGCEVRDECLELAMRNRASGEFGVWGGTVPPEREAMRAGRLARLTRIASRHQAASLAATRTAP